jgi:DNA-binding MurR/RpiR family transcriptional regulator
MLPPRSLAELRELIAKRQILVPQKSQRVLEYVLANPADVAFCNTRNLANNCGVSNATVSRTAGALGFDGFKALKEICRREITQRRD